MGEFYSTYLGNITLLTSNQGWRQSWEIIVPGTFSGSTWTGLLFYDRGAGVGEFYATDGAGGLQPVLTSYNDWRTTWTHIVPGNLGGSQTDLLFYDSNSGDVELYQVQGSGNLTDGQGNYAPWRSYPGWGAAYTHVIPGRFGGGSYTSFLFYNAATGQAAFYSSDGTGSLVPLTNSAWSANHTQIVPGLFGGLETDLLIYDVAGNAVSVFLEWQGNIATLAAGDLPFGVWTHIVPATYSDSGYTDLLFYDAGSGIGSFYRSETPVEWRTGLVQGYAGATSLFPGDTLTFHVSTKTGSFDLDISIPTADPSLEEALFHAEVPGTFLDIGDDAYQEGCGWPSVFDFIVPNTWATGLYKARISATDGTTTDTQDIPFVVKAPPGQQNDILCVVPFATTQAYNRWGGRSLYGHAVDDTSVGAFQWSMPRAFKVAFDRPTLYIAPTSSTSDVEYRWTPFVVWFLQNNYAVDYCTSVDLHADPTLLNPYSLVLSIGHDEYWSKEMRDNVETFVATGGNAAFFSGNTCWWQVRFDNNNHTMICYKDASLDPISATDPARSTVNWYDAPVYRPENSMTGVSWRYGAIRPAGNDTPAYFVVRNANHWVFAGTGLNDGDQFGTAVLLSSETDAALYQDIGGQAIPTGQDGTPLDFTIVATGDLPGWNCLLDWNNPRATMGVHRNGGVVFTATTTDWAQGLTVDGGPSTSIDVITTNVLTQLRSRQDIRRARDHVDWAETINRRPPDGGMAAEAK